MEASVMPEKSTTEKIFDELRIIAKGQGELAGDVRVIKEQMEHKPDVVEMRDYVDQRMEKHSERCPLASEPSPPASDPSQVVHLPMATHPESPRRTEIDWPKVARNAVYIAAVVGPATIAILTSI
jgi:hypothetical protein